MIYCGSDGKHRRGKGENAGNHHFLLILECYKKTTFFSAFFNLFLNKPLFLDICRSSLIKTLWENTCTADT